MDSENPWNDVRLEESDPVALLRMYLMPALQLYSQEDSRAPVLALLYGDCTPSPRLMSDVLLLKGEAGNVHPVQALYDLLRLVPTDEQSAIPLAVEDMLLGAGSDELVDILLQLEDLVAHATNIECSNTAVDFLPCNWPFVGPFLEISCIHADTLWVLLDCMHSGYQDLKDSSFTAESSKHLRAFIFLLGVLCSEEMLEGAAVHLVHHYNTATIARYLSKLLSLVIMTAPTARIEMLLYALGRELLKFWLLNHVFQEFLSLDSSRIDAWGLLLDYTLPMKDVCTIHARLESTHSITIICSDSANAAAVAGYHIASLWRERWLAAKAFLMSELDRAFPLIHQSFLAYIAAPFSVDEYTTQKCDLVQALELGKVYGHSPSAAVLNALLRSKFSKISISPKCTHELWAAVNLSRKPFKEVCLSTEDGVLSTWNSMESLSHARNLLTDSLQHHHGWIQFTKSRANSTRDRLNALTVQLLKETSSPISLQVFLALLAVLETSGYLKGVLLLLQNSQLWKRANVCRVIQRMTIHNDNQVAIAAAADAIPLLIELLRDGNVKVRSSAAGTLRNLAVNTDSQVNIAAAEDAIPLLVELLRDGNAEVRSSAAGTLRNLAVNTDSQVTVATAADAIPLLIELLRDGNAEVRSSAAATLRNLAVNDENKAHMAAESDAIPVLINLLQDGNVEVRSIAADALMIIAIHNANKIKIAEANAIPPLIELLRDDNPVVRSSAVGALAMLVRNTNNMKLLLSKLNTQSVTLNEFPECKDFLKKVNKHRKWF